MITMLEGFPTHVVAFAATGRLTREDYERVLMPAVEAGFSTNERLSLYYEIGPDFSGVDFGAAFDDMMVGLRHLSQWNRIAVVTDISWIAQMVSAFGFVMPATVRVFPLAEAGDARSWVTD